MNISLLNLHYMKHYNHTAVIQNATKTGLWLEDDDEGLHEQVDVKYLQQLADSIWDGVLCYSTSLQSFHHRLLQRGQ